MIRYVSPQELKPFEFYEHGINEIIRRSNGRMTFTPRDIYRHLRNDRARLFRVDDVGFFVVEQCRETLSGDAFLNVWLMWFQPGKGRAHKREVLDYLDALCAFHRCEWVDFGTTREAWGEVLKGEFEEHMITLRRMMK